MEKVYLSDGEEAELLTQYQDGEITKYVVRVYGMNDVYNDVIVSKVYDRYEDIPMYNEMTGLERRIEELKKEIKELVEKKEKISKKLKSIYAPKYSIGTKVYLTEYGNKVKELKINRIVFTEEEDKSYYEYYFDWEYGHFTDIGNGYYLTKEEAEKARELYLQQEEEKKRQEIIENYEKYKKEYEEIINSKKVV
jgi:hypothetical protein